MSILIAAGLCALGLVMLVAGAELVTRGGTAFAARLGVSPILIGLTVVAVGTSTPELAVGIGAAAQGNGALAVGNIAGANTVNLLLILGLSALLRPLRLRLETLRMDLPVMVAAALLLWVMARDGRLDRVDGMVLLGCGLVYTLLVMRMARQESRAVQVAFAREYQPRDVAAQHAVAYPLLMLLAGIVIIVLGADVFVDAAVTLARIWGVSDAFIGVTVVSIGTSSPELVTTMVSTIRGQRDIAIGNLLGSSVYNIVFILGTTSLVTAGGLPVPAELIRLNIPVMVLAAVVCVPVFLTGRRVSRMEGGVFVAAYLGYLAWLLIVQA